MTARSSDTLRRLASAVQDSGKSDLIRKRLGMVSAVTPGASTDGRAAVTVTVGGTAIVAPYLDSYTSPAVGDTVMVSLVDGSPLIEGRVVGFPSF